MNEGFSGDLNPIPGGRALTLLLAGSKRKFVAEGASYPPLLSRKPLVVASWARRHSKELVELSPKRTSDFKIEVNFRVKVRSKVKF